MKTRTADERLVQRGYRTVVEDVWQIGGTGLTDPRDAAVYLIHGHPSLSLVDSGAGASVSQLEETIVSLGFALPDIETLFLTHCHIDHVGGAVQIKSRTRARIVAHQLDRPALESADPDVTAAIWYGITLEPIPVDLVIDQDDVAVQVGSRTIRCLHTPGHTPGSLTLLLDHPQGRILFAQDVHGPFLEEFGSDLDQWERSMHRLLSLEADILCEGHYGVIEGATDVRRFIQSHLKAQGFRA